MHTRDRLQLAVPAAALLLVMPVRFFDVTVPSWVPIAFMSAFVTAMVIMRLSLDRKYPREQAQTVNKPPPAPGEPPWQ